MTTYLQSKYNTKRTFTPRKPVKTFRDLDIYQKTLECAVIVMKDIVPVLESFGRPDAERPSAEIERPNADFEGKSLTSSSRGLSKNGNAEGSSQHRHRDVKYPFIEGMVNCAMTVPLSISEAHSIRFGDFPLGMSLIEKAMSGCNKMIVYLEHIKGLYGDKIDGSLIDDMINRYAESRVKTFHLQLSWKKWNGVQKENNPSDNKVRL